MRTALLTAGFLLFSLVGFAPVASADDGRLAAATELMQKVTPKPNYDKMLKQMSTQMTAAMRAQGAKMPPDAAEKIPLVVAEALPYDEIIQWSAELYAEKFTVGELKELIAFYDSPVGKKLASLQPDLMGAVGKKIGALMPTRMPALMKKHGLL